jgi:uncharacterized CHY-type Zn-finger protein
MNLVKTIQQYNDQYVYFCEPTRNNIMNEGGFIRILYSTDHMMLNGIYLLININNIVCDKYYDKYRCMFNVVNHMSLIQQLKQIEDKLLVKVGIQDKIPQHKIHEQLLNGNIKIFNNIDNKTSCSFILKISGIWETQYNYGLTYKFMEINHP